MTVLLSPHYLSGDSLKMIQAGSPAALLVDGAHGMAESILKINPNCFVVGRCYDGAIFGDPVGNWYPQRIDPAGAADAWLDGRRTDDNNKPSAIERIRNNPLIKIWMGPNEPIIGTDVEKMRWYGLFSKRLTERLAAMGLRSVTGNFSTGNPMTPQENPRMWEAYLPAIDAVLRHNGFLGLHEYGDNTMFDGAGYLCLRYRQVYTYLKSVGRIPNLILTEVGTGFGIGGAWLDKMRRDRWASEGHSDPDAYYFEQLVWYDKELEKDSYVKGATIFTLGDDGTWGRHFGIGGSRLESMLVAHIQAHSGPPPIVVPVPPIGGTMAFNHGDTVYVIVSAGVKVRNSSGQQFDTASPNNSAKVLSGPRTLPGRTEKFWELDFGNNKIGFVAEVASDGTVLLSKTPIVPIPPGTGRIIYLRVKPHGRPRPIYNEPRMDSGYVKKDPSHDAWMEEVGGGWFKATKYRWSEDAWWFEIEGELVDGATLFDGVGWVQYRWNPENPNHAYATLEVKGMDERPLPDFEKEGTNVEPPVVVPPVVVPPVVVPPVVPPVPVGDNLLVNGDFGGVWTTDGVTGNQTPFGYEVVDTPNGQPNIWPDHVQGGKTIPSIAKVVPERVHKLKTQLPPSEHVGQVRALFLGVAKTVYKLFGKDSWSSTLRQVIHGTPGRLVRATAYILAETPDKPTADKLEDDHFRVRALLDTSEVGSIDNRWYSVMKVHRDVQGNERAWNLFVAQGVIKPDGTLMFSIQFQQMWPGVCDFFVGPLHAAYTDAAPPVEEPPVEEPPSVSVEEELQGIEALVDQIRDKTD